MFALVKTIILPLDPAVNRGKVCVLDKLVRRCTFAVDLFLREARERNVSARGRLEQSRRAVQSRSGLPSGFAQACRDRASALVRARETRYREWQGKVKKVEKELDKLEKREERLLVELAVLTPRAVKTRLKKEITLHNTRVKLERKKQYRGRLLAKEPCYPIIKRRQPVWFDRRIGSFEESKMASGFKYWVRISTLVKFQKLDLPVQVYPKAERYLRDPSWKRHSFTIVRDSRTGRYAVHLLLEKELAGGHLAGAWGVDPGMKRLVYAVNDNNNQKIVITGNDPELRPLLHDLRVLNNRIANLQRKGKTRALKRLRSRRRRKAGQIRGITARKTAAGLPATPVLVGVGYPANLRSTRGTRPVNRPGGRTGKPGHRISRKTRKRLNHWAYDDQGKRIVNHCLEKGHLALQLNEWKSTRTCSQCGSSNTFVRDRYFECRTCGFTGDRDANGGHNISYYTKWELYLQMNGQIDNPLLANVSPGFALPPSRAARLVRGTGGVPAVNPPG